MNTEAMHNPLEGSMAGRLTFSGGGARAHQCGVESYFADLVRGTETFCMPSGETHVERITLPSGGIAADFSEPGIVAAIRAAQAERIRYPEFFRQATAAGTGAYGVFLTGKKVIYFGRRGDFHVEEFARPRP
jgi:uncharacterized protein YbcV (DUF1398 family)